MSEFNYTDLPVRVNPPTPQHRQIRLLTIPHCRWQSNASSANCKLEVHDLSTAPAYEALSYTWGPEDSRDTIRINNKPFKVRANLFGALKRLRLPDRQRVIWIDAICTDQSSIPERNSTVKFMRDIYTSAKGGVVIWLGEEGPDTHLVDLFLDRLIKVYESKGSAGGKSALCFVQKDRDRIPHVSDPGYRALYNLLLTRWSSRVWVVQEAVMAPREPGIRAQRGSHVFSMEKIALAMSAIYKYSLEVSLGYKYPARFCTLWGERITRKDRPGLLDIVRRNWLTYATDPRDKIFGLAGMADDMEIPIEYDLKNTTEAVFTDFARRCILKYRNLEILGALSSTTHERLQTLPSWVPDWTCWNAYTFLMMSPAPDAEGRGLMHFTAAGTDHSTICTPVFLGDEQNELNLEGQIIDTIADDGPVRTIGRAVHQTLEFFRQSEYVAQAEEEYNVIGAAQGNFGDAKVEFTGKKKYPHTGEPLLQAFYAALTMDDLGHRHAPRRFDSFKRARRLQKTYFHFHEVTHALRESKSHFETSSFDRLLFAVAMRHYVNNAMSVCVNRCLVRTKNQGYLGIVTEQAQIGDSVVLFKGARVPFVIRSVDNAGKPDRKWQIIGDGYLHGIMSGEAWQRDKCEMFTFV